MAGIYIHIPFCASRCIYCGFYSTTRHDLRQAYVDAVCKELKMRIAPEQRGHISTIYIGGGTPSQLSPLQLQQIFAHLSQCTAEQVAETTIECNPDDITPEFVAVLKALPVNRVSMGAQTFSDERLRFLHRRHTAEQIPQAVHLLREAGFQNISLDLMYGFPGETLQDWHNDIDQALALNVEHLSAYSLMYEEDTPLHRLLEQGQVSEIDEELSLQMYNDLIDRLLAAGYEHYEISNFAKRSPGGDCFRSHHNSSYWHNVPYVGIGAAAHSYDGRSLRQWNVSNIEKYIEGIESGCPATGQEELDEDTRYNEQVMTALRTCEGLDLSTLSTEHRQYCQKQAAPFLSDNLLILADDSLRLTRRGLFVSNMVMSELMLA